MCRGYGRILYCMILHGLMREACCGRDSDGRGKPLVCGKPGAVGRLGGLAVKGW